jgi:PmbA protein
VVDEDFLKRIVREGEKYGLVEVALSEENTSALDFEREQIDSFTKTLAKQISIRITKGRKFGYSETSDLNKWRDCLLRAFKIMRASKEFDINLNISEKEKKKNVSCYDKKIEKLSFDEMTNICFKEIKSAKEFDNRIEIQRLNFEIGIGNTYFMNSNNVFLSEKYSNIGIAISVKAKNSIGEEIHTARRIKDFNSFNVGEKAAETCILSMNPKKVSTQRIPVIFDYHAISELISAILIPQICADRVQINRSLFKDKIGKKVFDEKLTIIDDPLIPNALASQSYDSEGVTSKRKVIVSDGVLNGFLYDITTAIREKKESTGNCNSLAIRPSVYATNFIIRQGEISNDEMIKESNKALFVKFVIGTHLINQISGDFSLGIENSFIVEKGKFKPIKSAMISGNLFELLNEIEQIGRESRQENEVISPMIKFKQINLIT